MKVLLLALLASLFSFQAESAIWVAENQWDNQWDKKWQAWVKSDALHRKIFKKRGTILHDFPTDCADALYVLRIYFAYKNKLPFIVNAPSDYTEEGDLLTNNSTMYDHVSKPDNRVRAFMHYVSQEKGTNSLTQDTYPLKIGLITSGDMYMTRWRFFGSRSNHSYIIKEVADDGNALFYWSDAPRKVRKLKRTKKYPDFVFYGKPWGYRRWKKPEHFGISEAQIPVEDGLSYEQYVLLKKYGPDKVLLEIRKGMRKR